jgi:hypothetical protein
MSEQSFTKDWTEELRSIRKKVLPWERKNLPVIPILINEETVVVYLKKAKPLIERGEFWYTRMRYLEVLLIIFQITINLITLLAANVYILAIVFSIVLSITLPLYGFEAERFIECQENCVVIGFGLWLLCLFQIWTVFRLKVKKYENNWLDKILGSSMFSMEWYFGPDSLK